MIAGYTYYLMVANLESLITFFGRLGGLEATAEGAEIEDQLARIKKTLQSAINQIGELDMERIEDLDTPAPL